MCRLACRPLIKINEAELSALMLGMHYRRQCGFCPTLGYEDDAGMQLWLIPSLYAGASIVAGFLVPRLAISDRSHCQHISRRKMVEHRRRSFSTAFRSAGSEHQTRRPSAKRTVYAYFQHLNSGIEPSGFDPEDPAAVRTDDRQGLGLSHRHDGNDAMRPGAQSGRAAS